MELVVIVTWICVAIVLVVAHAGHTRTVPDWALFFGAIFGALLGGFMVGVLHLPLLAVHRYSFSQLLGATVLAEAGILVSLSDLRRWRKRG